MNKTIFVPLLGLAALNLSCSHSEALPPIEPAIRNTDYEFSWSYERSTGEITVKLQNLLSKPLCFDSSNWPDQNGELHFGSRIFSVIISGVSYSFEDTNLGYLGGRYGPHLSANGELVAVINLSQFNVPMTVAQPEVIELKHNTGLNYCIE